MPSSFSYFQVDNRTLFIRIWQSFVQLGKRWYCFWFYWSLLNYVPCVLKSCSCVNVSYVLACSHANVLYVVSCSCGNVPWVLACLTWQNVLRTYVLTCQHGLRTQVLTCQHAFFITCVTTWSPTNMFYLLSK